MKERSSRRCEDQADGATPCVLLPPVTPDRVADVDGKSDDAKRQGTYGASASEVGLSEQAVRHDDGDGAAVHRDVDETHVLIHVENPPFSAKSIALFDSICNRSYNTGAAEKILQKISPLRKP